MAKQNKNNKVESFIPYIYVAPVKEGSKWYGAYENEKHEVIIQVIEKTKSEAQRVLEFKLKQQRKLDKKAAEKAAKKASKKGWNAKRHIDHANDECECSKCGEVKSFGDFYNDRTNKAGVQNFCKACIKAYQKERRAAAKA